MCQDVICIFYLLMQFRILEPPASPQITPGRRVPPRDQTRKLRKITYLMFADVHSCHQCLKK